LKVFVLFLPVTYYTLAHKATTKRKKIENNFAVVGGWKWVFFEKAKRENIYVYWSFCQKFSFNENVIIDSRRGGDG
jgi:hypothetical protein